MEYSTLRCPRKKILKSIPVEVEEVVEEVVMSSNRDQSAPFIVCSVFNDSSMRVGGRDY